ncbi:MAG: hypothetical protein LKK11_08880 [Acidaminococcus sp.]|jgi:hypothetical protein|nr:hypothetical protein [Acidaminococcus sp.]
MKKLIGSGKEKTHLARSLSSANEFYKLKGQQKRSFDAEESHQSSF